MNDDERLLSAASSLLKDSLLPDVLTHIDLAARLDLPADDVEALFETGALPGKKLAGKWILTREALLKALAPAPNRPGDLHVLRDKENEDE